MEKAAKTLAPQSKKLNKSPNGKRSYMVGQTYNDLKMYAVVLLKLQEPKLTQELAVIHVAGALRRIVQFFWRHCSVAPVDQRKYLQVSHESIRKKLRTFYRQMEQDWCKDSSRTMGFIQLASLSPTERDSLQEYVEHRCKEAMEYHIKFCPKEELGLFALMNPATIVSTIVVT